MKITAVVILLILMLCLTGCAPATYDYVMQREFNAEVAEGLVLIDELDRMAPGGGSKVYVCEYSEELEDKLIAEIESQYFSKWYKLPMTSEEQEIYYQNCCIGDGYVYVAPDLMPKIDYSSETCAGYWRYDGAYNPCNPDSMHRYSHTLVIVETNENIVLYTYVDN